MLLSRFGRSSFYVFLLAAGFVAFAGFVGASVAGAEAPPEDSVPQVATGDVSGPVDAGVVEGVPGSYVVSNAALRDDRGARLNPTPELAVQETVHGPLMTVDEAEGSYGFVGAPSESTVEAVVGASVFSAFRIRLVGRTPVEPQVVDGAVFYEGALPDDVSVETKVQAGALEDWIILPDAQAPHRYEYRISGPSGLDIEQLTQSTLRVVSGESVLLVTAPIAYDADGHAYEPELSPSASGFFVDVAIPADATYPVRIDPLFATEDSGPGRHAFTTVFCGEYVPRQDV